MKFDKETLSYIVPNSEENGFSPIIRRLGDEREPASFDKLKTIHDIFWNTATENPNTPFVGHRPFDPKTNSFLPYQFMTYEEVARRADNLGSGIIHIAQKHSSTPEEKETVNSRNWCAAIYSINRPEWRIVDHALPTQSLYSVALYDTLGESSTEYILNHSDALIVFCSLDKVSKLLQMLPNTPKIKAIICMDDIHSPKAQNPPVHIPSPFNTTSIDVLKSWAGSLNIGLYDMKEVEAIGAADKIEQHIPKPNDIYTLLYTSGTTGNPKGVVTTHHNYTESTKTFYIVCAHLPTPVYISYLPLAHCYGRSMENYVILRGGQIGYFCGDIARILEDCRALQPTVFPGVPRLLNRFYDMMSSIIENTPGVMGEISRRALSEKLVNLRSGRGNTHPIWDNLVFNKLKALISSNLNSMGSGSAPVEPRVLDFLRVVLSIQITEGFGMTENSASTLSQLPTDLTSGNIGVPLPRVEVRLCSVPEMNYYVEDEPCARGELLIRSEANFKEYLKEKEKTDEVMIGDRWFATGDIAKINPNGTISIIDRKKSIFKLSQGEYVAPERLENVLSKQPLILQSFIYGNSRQNHIVAVIVPDPGVFIPWATSLLKSKNEDEPCARGELLIRSEANFKEYLKEKEKTDEVMIGDRWFATGDIAKINPNGTISIIDRKKSIFKLSQGEYVAPERLENVLSKQPLILQSFIYGNSRQNHIVAVIVPDPGVFIPWATSLLKSKNEVLDDLSLESLTKNETVKHHFLLETQRLSRESKVQGFEIVKSIHLEHVPFDIEVNKLLTPTMKLKRFDAAKYYVDVIEKLYSNQTFLP
ncbi:hypothetical protein BB559_000799 [Furculomyces boomerangus]|uniref:AMP-dependent synthetase/ligase domain-containing protein n=1 Tax=Furculomyces boomerangus TaxID=61424 RepID=A0A2T9Z413_9FUNG|nr:hypothetical protein BB559_000799 [Furculomyces boomerangus]